MPILATDAKFHLNFSATPALPSLAEFELNNILTKVVQTELNCVKSSLFDSKNKYQKDIRGELRHSLLSEQKIQHKNIHVLKLATGLADRLSKSRKQATKLNEKNFNKKINEGSATSKTTDLKILLVKAASASHRARNILKRCAKLSEDYDISSTPIRGKIPFINEYLNNLISKNYPDSSLRVGSSANENGTFRNDSTDSLESQEEFEPQEYQSILETNIARYRENINQKNGHRDLLDQSTANSNRSHTRLDARASEMMVSKRPSLSTFSNVKSTATVFETNLNYVHKKLRINPHPLAIYNDLRLSANCGAEDKAFGGVNVSRKEMFNTSSEPKNGSGGPLCGASEILYLKLLLLTEDSIGSSSSGLENGTYEDYDRKAKSLLHSYERVEENEEEEEEGEDEEDSNQSLQKNLTKKLRKSRDHLFSFHPVQKHTPLHHTHRPTQSILKKNSNLRIKPELPIQRPGQSGIEELFQIKTNSSTYDSSLSDFSATGYFVPRRESSAPILTSLEAQDVSP